MEILTVIAPNKILSPIMLNMIEHFSKDFEKIEMVYSIYDSENFKNKKLLFILELNESGFDIPMLEFASDLQYADSDSLYKSTAALLVHSLNEMGTKRAAQDIIFWANNLGCSFIGQPVIEATFSLKNFLTWQKSMDIPLDDICFKLCYNLGRRLKDYNSNVPYITVPKITVLYSSPHAVSNTLSLWHMISKHLDGFKINEILIENGKVLDCKGCSYKLCLHYGKQNSCFYGGFMTDSVLPAVENADGIVWLCPNYNDSLSANLTAVINRLTVLYHKMNFYNKNMYGIIVSGNSGSDSVAKQLIGSLNINKGFKLPYHALITAVANDPNAIYSIDGIEKKAEAFSLNMRNHFLKNK